MMHVLGIVPNTLRGKSVVFAVLHGVVISEKFILDLHIANTFWECLQIREKSF